MSIHTLTAPAATLPLMRTAGCVYSVHQRPLAIGIASNNRRQFSTAKVLPFEFFSSKRSQEAKKEAPIVHSEPAWPHPVYTEKQMNDIVSLN